MGCDRGCRAAHDRRPHHPHRGAPGADRGRRGGCSPIRRSTRRAEVQLRLGHGVGQAGGDPRLPPHPRTHRRRPAHTRSPRRQPRPAGRELLPSAGVVVHDRLGRQAAGRRRARARARGNHEAEAPGRLPSRSRHAVRHGPRSATAPAGDVSVSPSTGTAAGRVLWVSGDTVLYDGVRQNRRPPADRHRHPSTWRRAVPVTGGVRYTMPPRTPSNCGRSSARAPSFPSTTKLEARPARPRGDRARVRERAGRQPPKHPLAAIGAAVELAD